MLNHSKSAIHSRSDSVFFGVLIVVGMRLGTCSEGHLQTKSSFFVVCVHNWWVDCLYMLMFFIHAKIGLYSSGEWAKTANHSSDNKPCSIVFTHECMLLIRIFKHENAIRYLFDWSWWLVQKRRDWFGLFCRYVWLVCRGMTIQAGATMLALVRLEFNTIQQGEKIQLVGCLFDTIKQDWSLSTGFFLKGRRRKSGCRGGEWFADDDASVTAVRKSRSKPPQPM